VTTTVASRSIRTRPTRTTTALATCATPAPIGTATGTETPASH
jgi:hypothetical protein